MATPIIPAEAKAYMASIGNVKSKAKAKPLRIIAAKGGKTVTPNKLTAIRDMTGSPRGQTRWNAKKA